MISQKHLQELFIFAKRTFTYDPKKWGDTLEEAIERVRQGYSVPYPLIKLLVQHMIEMQNAMLALDGAVEAKMVDMDERGKEMKEKAANVNKERLLTRKG
jgi:hypothetical protein